MTTRGIIVRAAFSAIAALLGLGAAAQTPAFELTSPGLENGDMLKTENVFNGFGCTGGNVSPALAWKDAPEGTKSFVLTLYDPDAPTGSGWWHWVVYDIPAATTGLPQGAGSGAGLPEGAVQGHTDFGSTGYGGPCPPPGAPHRYIFTLTALKVPALDVPENATAALIGFMTHANAIASAKLTLMYGR
jgi:Raf kinase inhibitor-like YbhB/YbcL family protein